MTGARRRLVVVGNGMAGARLVEDFLARGGGEHHDVTMFGDEPCGNYNRILLSSVLARSHDPKEIFINPLSWYQTNGVTLHAGERAATIDVAARTIKGDKGTVAPYDSLVIATGSRPLVPPIDGLLPVNGKPNGHGNGKRPPDPASFKHGVFVFRTLADCDRMLHYVDRVRRAAVIGGGLLGLEAARGLLNAGLGVHVVHLMSHLMETQLDAAGGQVLRRQLEQMGMTIHLGQATTAILGDTDVSGLLFKDGTTLDCEMVVIATGVRPNVEVAARAGLTVERGIVVGDDLACVGVDNVYAIGECAQHRGRVYGLVAPLWEQAQVLADRLSGKNPRALYVGSKSSTKLKVAGIDLAVMGDRDATEDDDEVVSYGEPARGVYKKLVVRRDRLVGAIVIGDGAIVPSLHRLFSESAALPDNRAELLFRAMAAAPSAPPQIPDEALVCNCNGVTKAQIIEAVLAGARSLGAVCDATRASTGCGSCRPEVEAIVGLACEGLTMPELLAEGDRPVELPERREPASGDVVVTLNKIERYKSEKDGLDVVDDLPRFAQEGWQAIDDGDRERLKWAGIFFRRQTPGRFMMRVRMSSGQANAQQIRTIAEITRDFGAGFIDITTRQQIQLRGYQIDKVDEIWRRLEAVGLVSLQTGMDNIRGVVGCPAAGLTKHELFDASPIAQEFTDRFLRNRAFTNLPRKFNVAITGCTEHCTHAESQDLALIPATRMSHGVELKGFNVLVGGKMGSGGYRVASPLDVFVEQGAAAALCGHVTEIFRDHGSRASRTKARLSFLVEAWGVPKFRAELERRAGRTLPAAGRDVRGAGTSDHLGVVPQKQPGLNYVGLAVPVGRVTVDQLFGLASIAESYGSGDVRITAAQNLIVAGVPDARLASLLAEPLLKELSPDPSGAMRGLVSCTGIDYCHFALIETKELAVKTARALEDRLPPNKRLTMHWSGCPAGCGNHAAADVGLLGKNVRIDGKVVDAVDIFVGGKSGPGAKAGTKILEDVPCDVLPEVLERLIPYLGKRPASGATGLTRPSPSSSALQAHEAHDAPPTRP
jgi:NAD(P)H-nitrite reductase large subunit